MPSRKRNKKKLFVPEEGENWEVERDRIAMETIARLQRENTMQGAKMQLALYCATNSISDAECQRIADRINYEHSEKNHLRNPKPLKSISDIIFSKGPSIKGYAKLKLERAKATDEEFARLQAKVKAESKEATDVPEGFRELGDDEKGSHKPYIKGAMYKFNDGDNWRYALYPHKGIKGAWPESTQRIIVPAPAPPVEEWRMLEIGEVILATDEQTTFNPGHEHEFIPVPIWNVGKKHTGKLKFRRRITP